jgi:2-dehydro-3-deoxygluconokinase
MTSPVNTPAGSATTSPDPAVPFVDVVTAGETMALLGPTSPGRLRHASRLRLGVAGAESNVAIAASRLGLRSRWVSRVGDDEVGRLVTGAVAAEGVDVSGVVRAPGERTGLMLRDQVAGGTRVHYYRDDSAATRLSPDDVPEELVTRATVLHLTGITSGLSATTAGFVRWALDRAVASGVTVSLDVNYRSKLWSADRARTALEELLDEVDVLFASHEEARALWGHDDAAELASGFGDHAPAEVVVKHGARTATTWTRDGTTTVDAFDVEDVIDPIGAGDAFAAGYLDARLRDEGIDTRLRTAHAMGALCVMTDGDYEGLPDRAELETFLAGDEELGR